MLYRDIEAIISPLATDVERRRALSNLNQDHTTGIVDGPTGTVCDKNYWERDYGLYDAVIAIFDILSGRDQDLFGSPLNIAGFSMDPVQITNNTAVATFGTVQAQSAMWTSMTSNSTFFGEQNWHGDPKFHSGLKVTDTMFKFFNTSFVGGNLASWDDYEVLRVQDRNLELHIPEDADFFRTTLTEGGSFKYRLEDRVPFCVSPYGRLSLNNLDYDDPANTPGISILADNESGSDGDIVYLTRTLLADNRSSMRTFIRNYLDTSGGAYTTDIQINTTPADNTSFVSFRRGGADYFRVYDNGNAWISNRLTVDDCASITGETTLDDLIVTGATTLTALTIFGDIISSHGAQFNNGVTGNDFTANDFFMATDGTNVSRLVVDADDASLILANGPITSAVNANAGHFGGSLAISSEHGLIALYNGVGGSVSGVMDLALIGNNIGNVPKLRFNNNTYPGIEGTDSWGVFVDVRGVLCATATPSANAGTYNTGYSSLKGITSTSVDITNQSALNTHCQGQSAEQDGAIVSVRHSSDSNIYLARFDSVSGNWEIIQ